MIAITEFDLNFNLANASDNLKTSSKHERGLDKTMKFNVL